MQTWSVPRGRQGPAARWHRRASCLSRSGSSHRPPAPLPPSHPSAPRPAPRKVEECLWPDKFNGKPLSGGGRAATDKNQPDKGPSGSLQERGAPLPGPCLPVPSRCPALSSCTNIRCAPTWVGGGKRRSVPRARFSGCPDPAFSPSPARAEAGRSSFRICVSLPPSSEFCSHFLPSHPH